MEVFGGEVRYECWLECEGDGSLGCEPFWIGVWRLSDAIGGEAAAAAGANDEEDQRPKRHSAN